MFDTLFSPITVNGLTLKNRIAYPSLGLLYSWDRKPNARYQNYFKEIAKGGAGIVTVGPVGVDFIGSGIAVLGLDTDEAIDEFKGITDTIRSQGASPWIQLFHAGAYSHPILINGQTPMAPSPRFSPYSKVTPREMDLNDITDVQEAYALAARRAVKAGFDGVEILASAGYLLTQFLSPLTNFREDDYGGSFDNRLRFPCDIIKACRQAVGDDVPLSIRMAGNDFVPQSNTDAETPRIAKAYQQSGIDLLNVTGGWHESKVPQLPMDLPRTGYAYLAATVRQATSVPVMASNRITTPIDAEKILNDGSCDMVNLGRVLIADPFWPTKAQEGRVDEIRPCVACSQGCTDQIFSGNPVSCVGNPRAGFEAERVIQRTEAPKTILVAGAGPSGLEAAVAAAQMGHRVHLAEATDAIGGQIPLAATPPHKSELNEFVRYYNAMIRRTGVTLSLNTPVTPEFITNLKPDHIIVAEGAIPAIPPIEGADAPGIVGAWSLLKKDRPLGRRVAVVGGGAVGLETAMHIAAKGTLTPEMLHFLMLHKGDSLENLEKRLVTGNHEVTVFEMGPKMGGDMGKSTKWIMMANLRRYGVELINGAKVTCLAEKKVSWQEGEKARDRFFDTVVLATGSRSNTHLANQLGKLGIPYTVVGDAKTPGKFDGAIHGGFLAALALENQTQ
ncbi:MAG: FAD-dependent oxidoreductase [Desulfobacterales bacterium]|nr:FAD-dependent oxidoreductase [Desulfobacterales bacterium]